MQWIGNMIWGKNSDECLRTKWYTVHHDGDKLISKGPPMLASTFKFMLLQREPTSKLQHGLLKNGPRLKFVYLNITPN